ncbi:MAG: fibronectin type III domain-containing protein [Opitutales bacterium]|nr:fibronectin type III domain-containing protein [Opitutales bacterium]
MKYMPLLKLSLSALFVSPAFAATYTWTNALGDNDFANLGNWGGGPTGFETGNHEWDVNLLGADRAVLSSVLRVERDVRVGDTDTEGELLITTGGHLIVTRNFRTARGGDSITGLGLVTVDGGGQLTSEQDLFFGQSLNSGNTFTLIDGTVRATRDLEVAHQAQTYSTVNILGGEMIAARRIRFSDGGSDESTSFLNISGNGILRATGVEDDEGAFSAGFIQFARNDGVATAHVNVSENALIEARDSVDFGTGIQSTSSLTMTGGRIATTAGASRFGYGIESQVTVDISGGLYEARQGFIGFGQGPRAEVTVNVTGGEIAADRIGVANNPHGEAVSTVFNMTGGRISLARTVGTATHSGGLRLQSPGASVNIGGTAEIHAEKLFLADGGLLTLSGDAHIFIAGSTDGENPTFDFATAFARGDWSPVLGKIAFNGGTFVVAGATNSYQLSDGAEEPTFTPVTVNYLELLNAAIAQGIIYTDLGLPLEARYDAGADRTEVVLVVPPPSVPTGLAVATVSSGALSVSWEAALGTVQSYRLERRRESHTDWNLVLETSDLGVMDSGLDAATLYEYRVRAANSGGFSDWSTPASGRTAAEFPPVVTIPNEWIRDDQLGWLYGFEGVNWTYSELIGFIEYSAFPWVYHASNGWLYFGGRSNDVLVFYSVELGWIFAFDGFPGLLYVVSTGGFIEL